MDFAKLYLMTNGNMQREADALVDILQPVLEVSVLLAAEYANACGRSTVFMQDFQRAVKYSAMNMVGKQVGSILTQFEDEVDEDEDEDEDEDDQEIEFVDEEDLDEEYTDYTGDNDTFNALRVVNDDWESWVPQNPAEEFLKNAIDSNEDLVPR
jgi:hypothetical protein